MNKFMKITAMTFVIVGSCLGYWNTIEKIRNKIQIKQMKNNLKKAMESTTYDFIDGTTDKNYVMDKDDIITVVDEDCPDTILNISNELKTMFEQSPFTVIKYIGRGENIFPVYRALNPCDLHDTSIYFYQEDNKLIFFDINDDDNNIWANAEGFNTLQVENPMAEIVVREVDGGEYIDIQKKVVYPKNDDTDFLLSSHIYEILEDISYYMTFRRHRNDDVMDKDRLYCPYKDKK